MKISEVLEYLRNHDGYLGEINCRPELLGMTSQTIKTHSEFTNLENIVSVHMKKLKMIIDQPNEFYIRRGTVVVREIDDEGELTGECTVSTRLFIAPKGVGLTLAQYENLKKLNVIDDFSGNTPLTGLGQAK